MTDTKTKETTTTRFKCLVFVIMAFTILVMLVYLDIYKPFNADWPRHVAWGIVMIFLIALLIREWKRSGENL